MNQIFMENKFRFNHQEAVKYVKTMLAYFGITNYKSFDKSYDVDNEFYYGSKTHHDYTKIYDILAPFEIGHIKIEILDASVSFHLTMDWTEKLDEDQKKLYKVDFFECSDDIWNIKLPNYSISERNVNPRSGYNFGNYIDEKTIGHFNDLFTIIFGDNYKTNYIVKLAAKHYEQNRDFNNFIELVAHAWNMYPDLWRCINDFGTQSGEITSIRLNNQYEDLQWYD